MDAFHLAELARQTCWFVLSDSPLTDGYKQTLLDARKLG